MSTETAEPSQNDRSPVPPPAAATAGRRSPRPGTRAAVVLLVVTLGLAPVAMLPAQSPIYAGIATLTPTLYTYTVAVVLCCVLMVAQAPRQFAGGLLPWVPVLVWLVTLSLSTWDLSARESSGLLHLCLGAATFAIGAVAAQDRVRGGWFISWVFAAVAWVQLLAIGAAASGFPLRTITGPQALDLLGRATGLTSHPGELSKLLFFCGMFALTLPQRTVRERWGAWLTLGLVLVGISLTRSRTVLVAIVSTVFIFVLMERAVARWQKRHFVIIGTTSVLGVASLPWLIERFMTDPGGGARQDVIRTALAVIQDHPWAGVGPNNYVATVGAFDALTATGVPVHNIFLLSAAELGVAGAVLLWLPFAAAATRAVYVAWRSRGRDLAARVLVSALPGLCLIGMTGWGLLQGPYFLIFSLVVGYLGARAGASHTEGVDGLQ